MVLVVFLRWQWQRRAPARRRPAGGRRSSGSIRAVRDSDQATVNEMVLRLSRSRRYLAPLAFLVGAFAMLFTGLRMLITNWRLMLIEVLPAMWIWAAMLNIKAHVLQGKSFIGFQGPALIPLVLLVAVITAASFYLNAVFAFAIANPGPAQISAGFAGARAHLGTVLGGACRSGSRSASALSSCPEVGDGVVPRHDERRRGRDDADLRGRPVADDRAQVHVLHARQAVGHRRRRHPRRGRVQSAYALGRVGILLLGSKTFFIVGVILLALGLTLQAGATGAIKAIKMSAKLVAGNRPAASTRPRQ